MRSLFLRATQIRLVARPCSKLKTSADLGINRSEASTERQREKKETTREDRTHGVHDTEDGMGCGRERRDETTSGGK